MSLWEWFCRRTLVLLHQISNPLVPDILHLLALSVQVRQGDLVVAQPALLRLRRVVVVLDRAVIVEVLLLVERREDAVVDGVTGAFVSLSLLSLLVGEAVGCFRGDIPCGWPQRRP